MLQEAGTTNNEFTVVQLPLFSFKEPITADQKFTFPKNFFFSFKSYLNNYLVGFYRSSYTDPAGATKYLAVTQFESHWARQAFPCLDEPDMKANFTVSLTTKKGRYSSLTQKALIIFRLT